MRPNHQNKRMRGRSRGGTGGNGGGGGGKGPNPLTRSYESNGPDVKIRGTAQHIAEKYLQMGRDAQATGDYVTAENYFQHGEHYLRIIATAHEAMRLANPQFRPYEPQDGEDGDEDEDGVPFAPGTPQPEIRYTNAPQPDSEQPDFQPQPREYRERPQQERSPRFEPRQDRRDDRRDDRRRDHQPRDGQPRDSQPRDSQPRDSQPREQRGDAPHDQGAPRDYAPRDSAPREFTPREQAPRESAPREFAPREGGRFDRRERFEQRRAPASERGPAAVEADVQTGLPAFITAPVRPLSEEQPVIAAPPSPSLFATADGTTEFPVNERRGRGRPRKVVPATVIDEAGE